jgi:hypothetical protein
LPYALATFVAAGMPIAITASDSRIRAPRCNSGGITWEMRNQVSTARADPHVPGPGLSFPSPATVAIVLAHNGARPRL